ncbi:MAG: N-acyl-L-homoserine lactone synthetase [Desulfobacteraceae bacterium]
MGSFKSVKRKIYRKLPKALRARLVRRMLPEFSLNLDNIIFRPAETLDDYIKSFRLVHDVFVCSGYIDPSPTALRITPHHCHPDSRVFIGMHRNDYQDDLIYTISVFPDSDEGLPMDAAFEKELAPLRAQGRKIVEAGALASNPLFRRRDMNIPMLGNRILQQYAMNYLGADDVVITVHPRYQWIYEDILLFEKIGEIKEYSYVKNNPAVAMRIDLRRAAQQYKQVYKGKPRKKDLYDFFFAETSSSILLPDKAAVNSSAIMVRDIMLYYSSGLK